MRPQWRLRGWELLPGPLVAQFRERMAGASMWGVSPHAKNTVFVSWGSVASPPPRSSVRLAVALWAWGHREPLGARLPLALVVACSERRGPMGRPHSWISHRPVGWLRRTLWAQWLSGRTSCFAPFGRCQRVTVLLVAVTIGEFILLCALRACQRDTVLPDGHWAPVAYDPGAAYLSPETYLSFGGWSACGN